MSDLEKLIKDKLKNDHVSFAELRNLPGFAGDGVIEIAENVILWSGVSPEAHAILKRMRRRGEFHYEPTAPLIYYIDGCALQLPIAKKAKKYKRPHWLPVVLVLGPE